MKRLLAFGAVAILATVVFTMPARAGGTTYDKLALLTFSGPVQVPGATLYGGTYRFHLTNPDTGRSVIQVLSGDGAIVYSMFHTIPDIRVRVTEDPFVTFREVPEGVPPPIDVLFYGGEYRGYAFVYPKGGPSMMPWPPVPEPVEYSATPVWTPAPVLEPPLRFTPTQPIESFPLRQVPAPVTPEPVELPRTASPLPLVAAGGAASMLAGLLLALRRRRG